MSPQAMPAGPAYPEPRPTWLFRPFPDLVGWLCRIAYSSVATGVFFWGLVAIESTIQPGHDSRLGLVAFYTLPVLLAAQIVSFHSLWKICEESVRLPVWQRAATILGAMAVGAPTFAVTMLLIRAWVWSPLMRR